MSDIQNSEHRERLEAMVTDREETWDLSPNDKAAISWALENLAPVAPSRSAAPPPNPGMDYWWNRWIDSEEPIPVSQMRQPQAMTAVCHALDFAQWFADRCAEFGRDYRASAAPPSEREAAMINALERVWDSRHEPDKWSLEVSRALELATGKPHPFRTALQEKARAAVPQAAALDKLSREPVFVLDHGAENGIARYEVRFGHENVYNTACEELAQAKAQSLRNEISAVVADILQARAAAVPAPPDNIAEFCKRLATLRPNPQMIPADLDEGHTYRVGFFDCLSAVAKLFGAVERAGATAPPKEQE